MNVPLLYVGGAAPTLPPKPSVSMRVKFVPARRACALAPTARRAQGVRTCACSAAGPVIDCKPVAAPLQTSATRTSVATTTLLVVLGALAFSRSQ